jgi:hypothetical protein
MEHRIKVEESLGVNICSGLFLERVKNRKKLKNKPDELQALIKRRL